MRGVVVGVVACVLASGAQAATWRCQFLGYRACEAGTCTVNHNRGSFDIDESKLRNGQVKEDGDEFFYFTPVDRRFGVWVSWGRSPDDKDVDHGYCSPIRTRR